MQPLSGLLVLDFTTLLPGPLATLLLAEAGAEVIKIERPGGEDMRRYEPRFDGESAMFALLNRGKTSLVLDLKSEADRAKLKPHVLAAGPLDLDDLGAGLRQQQGGERPWQQRGEIEDEKAGQRLHRHCDADDSLSRHNRIEAANPCFFPDLARGLL